MWLRDDIDDADRGTRNRPAPLGEQLCDDRVELLVARAQGYACEGVDVATDGGLPQIVQDSGVGGA